MTHVMTRDGEIIELPDAQALRLAKLGSGNPFAYWHLADCGCCVCLHPEGDPSRGYLIGEDGGYEYHEDGDG